MVECFNNHQLRVSRFGLWAKEKTVVVHITLRSWALENRHPQFSKVKEDEKIYLPDILVKLHNNPSHMGLKVSSIGMSTNQFGDFSKCSVVTDLLQDKDIKGLGEKAQKIWDGFTHQPQTGRFVVFSVVLGLLCQEIVADYHRIIDDLLDKTELEKEVVSASIHFTKLTVVGGANPRAQPSYLRDPKELRGRDADAELRSSLWRLEALYTLSNTVAMSVETIEEAIAGVKTEIEKVSAAIVDIGARPWSDQSNTPKGPGKRTPELENTCRKHMETLKRSFSDLTAVQIGLKRKVEFNRRYSGAVSKTPTLASPRGLLGPLAGS